MLLELQVDPEARTKGLRNCELIGLDPPGAQKLDCCRRADTRTETMLQAHVRNRLVVLIDGGSEEEIAPAIPGQQRISAPRPTHAKVNRSGKVPGVQILVGERTRFMNRIAGKREPIADRTASHINELTKQILVH